MLKNLDYFKSKREDILGLPIVMDNGYHPQKLTIELEKTYPKIMSEIS